MLEPGVNVTMQVSPIINVSKVEVNSMPQVWGLNTYSAINKIVLLEKYTGKKHSNAAATAELGIYIPL